MSAQDAQEQIGRLQGLLERIKRNAAAPRGGGSLTAAPFAPAVAAAPRIAPPATAAQPPAPFARATFASAADQSVDDLLGDSVQTTPPPREVEVSLDSFAPPPVEAALQPSEAPEADPIPLVSTSQQMPEPPAFDDAFSLESEVSEVRAAPSVRAPAVEVTLAAIEAEAEQLATEELSDDDLVEVTEGTPEPSSDLDFEDEDEPPASSRRKVAGSMDEALAAAAAQLEAEREVPFKTPPPESGPQEAPPPNMAAPAAPDLDALLGGELDIPTREAEALPTTEQLGQTIDLEEARGPSLELAEHASDHPAASSDEELEVALPPREASAGYHDDLAPPAEARDELQAHRRRQEEEIPPPPESLAQLPSAPPGPPIAEIIPLEAAPAAGGTPEIVARPIPMGSPEAFASVRESFRPSTFAELLDASLSLNGR